MNNNTKNKIYQYLQKKPVSKVEHVLIWNKFCISYWLQKTFLSLQPACLWRAVLLFTTEPQNKKMDLECLKAERLYSNLTSSGQRGCMFLKILFCWAHNSRQTEWLRSRKVSITLSAYQKIFSLARGLVFEWIDSTLRALIKCLHLLHVSSWLEHHQLRLLSTIWHLCSVHWHTDCIWLISCNSI